MKIQITLSPSDYMIIRKAVGRTVSLGIINDATFNEKGFLIEASGNDFDHLHEVLREAAMWSSDHSREILRIANFINDEIYTVYDFIENEV